MLVNKLPRVVSRALVINIRARAQKEAHSEGMCVKVPKYWNINLSCSHMNSALSYFGGNSIKLFSFFKTYMFRSHRNELTPQ